MEWRQVVQCDVIDISVILQQLPHTVHVIPLGRHVDGRQTILQERERGREREGGVVGGKPKGDLFLNGTPSAAGE